MKKPNKSPEDFAKMEEFYIPYRTAKSLSKLFKIEMSEVQKHSELFYKIDPYMAQALDHLSEISSEDLKLSAVLSLNYILNYKESAFE